MSRTCKPKRLEDLILETTDEDIRNLASSVLARGGGSLTSSELLHTDIVSFLTDQSFLFFLNDILNAIESDFLGSVHLFYVLSIRAKKESLKTLLLKSKDHRQRINLFVHRLKEMPTTQDYLEELTELSL